MNTDQCVLATALSAEMKGFDTILLNDGCVVTDSKAFAQQGREYDSARAWGFLSSCKALAKATARLRYMVSIGYRTSSRQHIS